MSKIEIANLQSAELSEELSDAELTTVVGGASATVGAFGTVGASATVDENNINSIARFAGLDSADSEYAQAILKRFI